MSTESKPEMVSVPRATLEQWSDLAGEWNDVSKKWVYEEIQELLAATPAAAAPQEADARLTASAPAGPDPYTVFEAKFATPHTDGSNEESDEDQGAELRTCPHCGGETTAHIRHCDFCGEPS